MPLIIYKNFIKPLITSVTGYLFPCRFTPSCSVYAHQSLHTHGIIKGSLLAIARVLRCNPLFKGGHDPVVAKRIVNNN